MTARFDFLEAAPSAAAASFDSTSIHLWRIPYASSQGRAPLLRLLGAYLHKPASEVTLVQDARGKPQLDCAHSACGDGRHLEFNWSHSGGYALVALSRGMALGVDLERIDRHLHAAEIACRYFDSAEADALASMARPARTRAFIGLWCAKEAVLKAVGEGLSFGLARLAFEWQAGMDWRLARVDPALGERDEWQLAGFAAAPGYRGALAWRGACCEIAAFQPAA